LFWFWLFWFFLYRQGIRILPLGLLELQLPLPLFPQFPDRILEIVHGLGLLSRPAQIVIDDPVPLERVLLIASRWNRQQGQHRRRNLEAGDVDVLRIQPELEPIHLFGPVRKLGLLRPRHSPNRIEECLDDCGDRAVHQLGVGFVESLGQLSRWKRQGTHPQASISQIGNQLSVLDVWYRGVGAGWSHLPNRERRLFHGKRIRGRQRFLRYALADEGARRRVGHRVGAN